ncbi:hypothetical protein FOMPIDRAFT_1134403, partial [Fomitopsis schrenkii]
AIQTLAASVVDLCITICLTYIFHEHQGGLKRTNSIIHKLTIYVINRGVLTMVVEVTQFIVYVSLPYTEQYWSILHFPGSKGEGLYTKLSANIHYG